MMKLRKGWRHSERSDVVQCVSDLRDGLRLFLSILTFDAKELSYWLRALRIDESLDFGIFRKFAFPGS